MHVFKLKFFLVLLFFVVVCVMSLFIEQVIMYIINEQRFSWQLMVKGHMYLGCDSLVCSLNKKIIIIIIKK
jgi:hypothetical protein